jgi:hypothetical protein
MGKNRIKDLRDITVGGEEYKWLVEYNREIGNKVKIWHNKKVIWDKVIQEDEITPSIIKDTIEGVNLINELL